MVSTQKKLLIDCDTGTDDAQAIMMAVAQPHVDICALTSVFGNAPQDVTATNNLRMLKYLNRLDIPVYKGASMTLVGNKPITTSFHGVDGLGDVTIPNVDPVDTSLLKKEHAAVALTELVKKHPGEYTLVATGPLTNIALAIQLDRDFGSKLKGCFVMGGSSDGKGNITPTAEFNFYEDPEAAKCVLENLGCLITLAPLNTCEKYSWTWEEYDKYLAYGTKKVDLVRLFEAKMVREMKAKHLCTYWLWDQLAMAAAINDTVVTKYRDVYASVEVCGSLTRGQVVIDWHNRKGRTANLRIIDEVDLELYTKLVYQAVDD